MYKLLLWSKLNKPVEANAINKTRKVCTIHSEKKTGLPFVLWKKLWFCLWKMKSQLFKLKFRISCLFDSLSQF